MVHGRMILVDPMLSPKGALGKFPWTDHPRPNPLVDLPFPADTLSGYLDLVDAVVVTHLHPDHWDEAAIHALGERQPMLICPTGIAAHLAGAGFRHVAPVTETLHWNGIRISATGGRHGTGEIGVHMGPVSGFVFDSPEGSIYLAGDTIWCPEVEAALQQFRPQHVVVAGGAAQFAIGGPVTMPFDDILKVCRQAPRSKVWVTHLEAIAPCREGRADIRAAIRTHGLDAQCFVPEDGETVYLHPRTAPAG